MQQRVLLVDMPFGGADRPAIGISILKAALTARRIECDIRYLNLDFARMAGPQLYQWFADCGSHMLFAGEWMFAKEFFGAALPSEMEFLRHLKVDRQAHHDVLRAASALRKLVRPFLQESFESVPWDAYGIVGFTSTFEQNLSSLALAHTIKDRYPSTTIVMGGANCDGDMGIALHRHFPYLDYVFVGAADDTFPEFVERLYNDEDVTSLPGIVYRDGPDSRLTAPPAGMLDLDKSPIPDYTDYFKQLSAAGIEAALPIRLQIETSRGCWWGMKHHCTFCGMNATTMRFRSKSKERVLKELSHLVNMYGVRGIDAVDAIMDMTYFRDVLPSLIEASLDINLYYEIKANLSKRQVKMLADAGVVFIQPGIESFSTRLLKVMRKGTTAHQNVQLLKWCRQFGVEPTWNLLYGFPSERPEDYDVQQRLLRAIMHLTPPRGVGQLRMDRFSPHFERFQEFGFTNIRPLEAYRYIYPLPVAAIFEICYFFDYDYVDRLDPEDYIMPIREQITAWRLASQRGDSLQLFMDDGQMLIRDTRNKDVTVTLTGWRRDAYAICDQSRSFAYILRALRQPGLSPGVAESELLEFLHEMTAQDLMICEGDHYLAVAVGQPLDDQLPLNLENVAPERAAGDEDKEHLYALN